MELNQVKMLFYYQFVTMGQLQIRFGKNTKYNEKLICIIQSGIGPASTTCLSISNFLAEYDKRTLYLSLICCTIHKTNFIDGGIFFAAVSIRLCQSVFMEYYVLE
eukprot:249204_1